MKTTLLILCLIGLSAACRERSSSKAAVVKTKSLKNNLKTNASPIGVKTPEPWSPANSAVNDPALFMMAEEFRLRGQNQEAFDLYRRVFLSDESQFIAEKMMDVGSQFMSSPNLRKELKRLLLLFPQSTKLRSYESKPVARRGFKPGKKKRVNRL